MIRDEAIHATSFFDNTVTDGDCNINLKLQQHDRVQEGQNTKTSKSTYGQPSKVGPEIRDMFKFSQTKKEPNADFCNHIHCIVQIGQKKRLHQTDLNRRYG